MNGLSTRDWTQRDMLRSTAALIQARWPTYGDLAGRLEELARSIEHASQEICELAPQEES